MITPTDLADKARELSAHPTIGSLAVARELAALVLAYEQQCERRVAVAEAKRRYPDKWAEYDEADENPNHYTEFNYDAATGTPTLTPLVIPEIEREAGR